MNKSEILVSLLEDLKPYMTEASGLIEVLSRGMLNEELTERILGIITEKIRLVSDEALMRKFATVKDMLAAVRQQELDEQARESREASRILHSFE